MNPGERQPAPDTTAVAVSRSPHTFLRFPDLPAGDPVTLNDWLDTARIQPVSAVEWRVTSIWHEQSRVVPDNMWFWFRRGTATARVGLHGRPFRVTPGGVMLVPQDTEHHIRQDRQSGMEFVTVHFLSSVYGGVNLLELLGFPTWLPGSKDAPYERINLMLTREAAVRAPGWRRAMQCGIRELLLYAVRHAGSEFRTRAHPELPRLAPALAWIETHLGDPDVRVGDLAARAHMSEVHFRKLFKRVIDTTPSRFIQRRRIDRACVLLRDTTWTIDQVAHGSGFSDTPYFCRVFKDWTGVTPTRYRRLESI